MGRRLLRHYDQKPYRHSYRAAMYAKQCQSRGEECLAKSSMYRRRSGEMQTAYEMEIEATRPPFSLASPKARLPGLQP